MVSFSARHRIRYPWSAGTESGMTEKDFQSSGTGIICYLPLSKLAGFQTSFTGSGKSGPESSLFLTVLLQCAWFYKYFTIPGTPGQCPGFCAACRQKGDGSLRHVL